MAPHANLYLLLRLLTDILQAKTRALQATPPPAGASGFEFATPPGDNGQRSEPDRAYQPRAAAARSRLGADKAGTGARGKSKAASAVAKRGAPAAAKGQKDKDKGGGEPAATGGTDGGGGGGAGGGAAAEAPCPSQELGGSFTGVLRKVQDALAAPDDARAACRAPAKQPRPDAAPRPAGPSCQAGDVQGHAAGEEAETGAAEEGSSESDEPSPEPASEPVAAAAEVALQARALRMDAPTGTLALATATLAVRGPARAAAMLPVARAAQQVLKRAAPSRKPAQAPRKRAAPGHMEPGGPLARGPDADTFQALPDLPHGVFSGGASDVIIANALDAEEEEEDEDKEGVCIHS